ncbi:hypothetical protein GS538_09260 [Rhodococcus hoagii]|nr:hypothetical protein [Prescottella equi]
MALTTWLRKLLPGRRPDAATTGAAQRNSAPAKRNPPPTRKLTYEEQLELLDAYVELRDAEKQTGATLMCARGADMSDAKTVRQMAKLLLSTRDEHPEAIRFDGTRSDTTTTHETEGDGR